MRSRSDQDLRQASGKPKGLELELLHGNTQPSYLLPVSMYVLGIGLGFNGHGIHVWAQRSCWTPSDIQGVRVVACEYELAPRKISELLLTHFRTSMVSQRLCSVEDNCLEERSNVMGSGERSTEDVYIQLPYQLIVRNAANQTDYPTALCGVVRQLGVHPIGVMKCMNSGIAPRGCSSIVVILLSSICCQ